MRLGTKHIGIIASLLFFSSESFASFQDELQFQIFHYASDNAPTIYLSDKTIFETQNFLTKVDFYFESGLKGAWSLDPDPLRYTLYFDDSEKSLMWFGREHPLNLTRGYIVEPTSALGSVWVQNQLDALNPRVNGWIGTGIVHELDPKWKFIATYSPLFIPTFGPSLGFTDRGDLNPSRFARLPPSNVITGGVNLPIRYQLRLNQLSELLFRHQVFMGLSHDDPNLNLDAYVYTAPRPMAVPLTDATLAVNQNDVNAKVYIDPQFPREYWSGMRSQLKELPFHPSVELVQNLTEFSNHIVSLTGYFESPQINPFVVKRATRGSFGILSHFQKEFTDPQFGDFLIFLKLPLDITYDLAYRSLVESTLMTGKQSLYWLNELEYTMKRGLSLLLALRILAGEDNSYFGAWRNQSSYSIGVKQLL